MEQSGIDDSVGDSGLVRSRMNRSGIHMGIGCMGYHAPKGIRKA